MKVHTLIVRDYKSIHEQKLSIPDAVRLVIVEGRNASGKSTLLETIKVAVGGGKYKPTEPVRAGEDQGQIILETEKFKHVISFTNDKSKFELTLADGSPRTDPIDTLKQFYNALSFNPAAFISAPPKERNEMFKNLLGLDFTTLDARYSILYNERTGVNKTVREAKLEFGKLEYDNDAPKEEISLEALTRKMQQLATSNAANQQKRTEVAEAETRLGAMDDAIKAKALAVNNKQKHVDDLRAQLEAQEAELVTLSAEFQDMSEKRETFAAKIPRLQAEALALTDANLSDVRDEIQQAEAINMRVRKNFEYFRAQQVMKDREEESGRLTEQLTKILNSKLEMIAGVKMPVPGLAYKVTEKEGKWTEEILYLNLPFDQASTAEQLRVSTKIGLLMNADFKVMLIEDASLLDINSMKIMYELAVEHDAQIWLERVNNSPDLSVRFISVEPTPLDLLPAKTAEEIAADDARSARFRAAHESISESVPEA